MNTAYRFAALFFAALVSVAGLASCTNEKACRPGTVLVTVACPRELGTSGIDRVDVLVFDEATGRALGSITDLELTCGGSASVEVTVKNYNAGRKFRVDMVAKGTAPSEVRTSTVVELVPGCTANTITLPADAGSGGTGGRVAGAGGGAGGARGGGGQGGGVVAGSGGGGEAGGGAGGQDAGADTGSALRERGDTCAVGAECASGFCVDSVCCAAACDGVCLGCSQALTGKTSGECQPLKAGEGDKACEGDTSACGKDGKCDGAGACKLRGSETVCAAATCSNSVSRAAGKCTGSGQCGQGAEINCGGYACEGSACKSSCAGDGDCVGLKCIDGKCGGKRGVGGSCNSAAECSSGHCVDGYCCNDACGGACKACANSLTGAENGVCANVKANGPDAACGSSPPCGNDGTCDGAGACKKAPATTMCGGASCTAANAYQGPSYCSGTGACATPPALPCGTFVCRAAGCKTVCANDADCVTGNFCDGGSCVPKRANGQVCTPGSDYQCASGVCAGGYCCSGGCAGTCNSCKTGSCSNVCEDRILKPNNRLSGTVSSDRTTRTELVVLRAGEYALDYERVFLTFDLSMIPAGSTVVSAELQMKVAGCYVVADGDPEFKPLLTMFSNLGDLLVERVVFGPMLDAADLTVSEQGNGPRTMRRTGDLVSPPIVLDVTDWLNQDLQGRSVNENRAQLRVRFAVNVDADTSRNASCEIWNTAMFANMGSDEIRLRIRTRPP